MATIYKWRRMSLPGETGECIKKLDAAHAKGRVKGIAFVAILDGNGYVAETCGEASTDLDGTIKLLRVFEAKLVKRQLR